MGFISFARPVFSSAITLIPDKVPFPKAGDKRSKFGCFKNFFNAASLLNHNLRTCQHQFDRQCRDLKF
jgi:hypothetical protein